MNEKHAPLTPSSAARWMACPGSLTMEAQYPQPEDDPATVEGTLAHLVVSNRMNGSRDEPAGTTEEMREGADIFEDTVYSRVIRGTTLLVEHRIKCLAIHPDNWGTLDCGSRDNFAKSIEVWDYKFGRRYINVIKNWQLVNYAFGVLCESMPEYDDLPNWQIHMHLIQPRYYGPEGQVRSWSITGDELLELAGTMSKGAAMATRAKAQCITNSECRDCSARHACPTLQKVGGLVVDMTGQPTPFNLPVDVAATELATLQTAADRLKARISGLESELTGQIKLGVNVPGWMLKQGAGREKWSVPVDEAISFGEMMGVDIRKPDVMTPKQAIKAGVDANVIAAYTERPAGKIELVRITDETSRRFTS